MIVLPPKGFAYATKLTSRMPPKPELLVVVKGVYALKPDAPLELLERKECMPTGDQFAPEDDDRTGACFAPTDFADAKMNAEVFVRGSFHAPGGRPVKESEVGFSIAGLSKRLRVVGPRVWVDDVLGSAASEPLAMTSVLVDWTTAYGGPGFAGNTSGRGHTSRELPQLEAFDAPVRSRGNHNVAASFGPISPNWPERAKKVGTRYGKAWREQRSPFVAEDFDWTYHQAAPADQQLPGFLKGDETIIFENFHPQAALLSAKLPGLRMRGFARTVAGEFRSFGLQLDTVVADLDKGTLALTWRGHLPIRELDYADIKSMLLACELLGEVGSERAYQEKLEAFERDPVGFEEARSEMIASMAAAAPTFPGDAPQQLDVVSAALAKKLPAEFQGVAKNLAIGMAEASKARGAEPEQAEADQKLVEALSRVDEAEENEPPPPIAPKPGAIPSIGLRKVVRQMMADLSRGLEGTKDQELTPEQAAQLEKLNSLPLDPNWTTLDPEYTIPEPLSTDAPGPYANLIDRDFTGQDLSGLDLSGAKLDGAVLTRARLVGTKLRGASLRGAVLYRAEAEGADFSEVDFTRANCARLRARSANFSSATLELAFFEDAELEEACFEGTQADWSAFARANLARVKGRGLKFYRTDFEESDLTNADFSNGSVRACVFSRCKATGLDLTKTEVRAISAQEANFGGAKFVRAHGERMNLINAELDGADFTLAVVSKSHFSGATARGCEFWGADLSLGRFYRADLSRSRFDHANLLGADLSRARLEWAGFQKANLYDAKLIEAFGQDTNFTGANLERCNYSTRNAEDA
jgi:uncharacterized protein YjbI with pentapeptide repeats